MDHIPDKKLFSLIQAKNNPAQAESETSEDETENNEEAEDEEDEEEDDMLENQSLVKQGTNADIFVKCSMCNNQYATRKGLLYHVHDKHYVSIDLLYFNMGYIYGCTFTCT